MNTIREIINLILEHEKESASATPSKEKLAEIEQKVSEMLFPTICVFLRHGNYCSAMSFLAENFFIDYNR